MPAEVRCNFALHCSLVTQQCVIRFTTFPGSSTTGCVKYAQHADIGIGSGVGGDSACGTTMVISITAALFYSTL